MLRKYLMVLGLIVVGCITTEGQNIVKIAVLKDKLTKEKSDTTKVMLLNDLYVQYREYDSAMAMLYANQGIELSKRISFKKGESLLLLNKGVFFSLNGANFEAEHLIRQSLKIRESTKDLAGQGYCLRSLGNLEYDKNNYKAALDLYFQAAEKFENGNDKKGLAGDYIWIGNVFNEGLHQFDKSVEYFNKSLELAKELNDSSLISYNYNNLGQAYHFQKNYEKALAFYIKSKNMKLLLADLRATANTFDNISSIYFEIKKNDSALLFNDSALNIRQSQRDKKGIASSLINAANIFLIQKRLTEAYNDYQKAVAIAKEIQFKEPIIEGYNGLSKYYEATGHIADALKYFKLFKEANDSVFNANVTMQISTLEAKYNTTQKQQQIDEQKFELLKRSYWIVGISIFFVFILLLGYSFYRRYKLQQQTRLQQEILNQQDLATKAVLAAEETERKRIATDLHDGVGQLMSAAKMNLSAIESDLNFTSIEQKQAYDKAMALVDEGCKEVRAVSHNMMPNALLRAGLASAVREFLDNLNSTIIKINLYTDGLNERIDSNAEIILYRVIQECVNNVIKHAKASLLDISIVKEGNEISVTIEDNGVGFDKKSVKSGSGIGLKNIETRMAFLKGSVEWESELGKGTLVVLHANC